MGDRASGARQRPSRNVWTASSRGLVSSLQVVKRDPLKLEKHLKSTHCESGTGPSEMIMLGEKTSVTEEDKGVSEWTQVLRSRKPKDVPQAPVMTEDELKKIKELSKEKRKLQKEKKRAKKEEEARMKLYKSKDSRLHIITSLDVIHQQSDSQSKSPLKKEEVDHKQVKATQRKTIKFQEDEYPELNAKTKPQSSSAVQTLTKVLKSNLTIGGIPDDSEWETEAEDADDPQSLIAHIDDTTIDGGNFASIVKRNRGPATASSPAAVEANHVEEVKKVKKKDPIVFDLLSALEANQQKQKLKKSEKKSVAFVTSRKTTITAKGNRLDATAPSVRRGKERERPKKKKKSKLKSIIVAEREKKKLGRVGSQKVACDHSPNVVTEHEVLDELEKQPEVVSISEFVDPVETVTASYETSDKLATDEAKAKIHNRKFRPYCDHLLSKDLDYCTTTLLRDIVRFQDNMHAKDPSKAKVKRRYVIGLREVKKLLAVNKISLLILAPDIENVQTTGGLNDFVNELKDLSQANNTLVIYALNRHQLGRVMKRKVPIACVGVLNYQGSEENFKKIRDELLPALKDGYKAKLESVGQPKPATIPEQPILPSITSPPPPVQSYWASQIEDPSEEIKQAFLERIRRAMNSS